MALTVNLKPSGWQYVGSGKLIYQFTESTLTGKPNYRVEIEFFNYFAGIKWEFRPSSNLVIKCDIAKILSNALVLGIQGTDRLRDTYVKYQAVWDGGSDTQVSLTADIIYFLAGSQHLLNARTKFDVSSVDSSAFGINALGVFLIDKEMIQWQYNRRTTIDFLCDGTLPANAKFIVTGSSGVLNTFTFDGSIKVLKTFQIQLATLNETFITIAVRDFAETVFYAYHRSEQKDVLPACESIRLSWINDYAGTTDYTFYFKSKLKITPDRLQRYMSRTLYADNLSQVQWQRIQEVKRQGQVYNEVFRVGTTCEDITNAFAKLRVLIAPDAGEIKAEAETTSQTISIRYVGVDNPDFLVFP